jgi:hypothetical protein
MQPADSTHMCVFLQSCLCIPEPGMDVLLADDHTKECIKHFVHVTMLNDQIVNRWGEVQ